MHAVAIAIMTGEILIFLSVFVRRIRTLDIRVSLLGFRLAESLDFTTIFLDREIDIGWFGGRPWAGT